MRTLLLILLGGVAASAEVARRDLQLAIEHGDGGFSYSLDTDLGTFAGEDAFDRVGVVRLGGRLGFGGTGSSLAALVGGDATLTDAPIPGGGLEGAGLDLTAGATWAFADGWSIDGEGFAGWQQASLALKAGSAPLDGEGDLLRGGMRLRLMWSPWMRWSIGAEAGWMTWETDMDAGGGRQLALDGSGITGGLVLAWRPSIRPAGIE